MDIEKIRSTARTPSYSGKTSGSWSKPDLEDFGFDSVEEMSPDDRQRVASTSLLGSVDAETFTDLVFFPVVEPNTGNLNENALRAVISGRGAQADIPDSARESAQSKARGLLQDEFGMNEEQEKELEMLDDMSDITKEDLIDTVKQVRKGELDLSKALEYFIDVDKEIINEIKDQLDDIQEKEKAEKEQEEETDKDKDEDKTLEDIANEMAKEEDISKNKAMVKVLEEHPELYTEYKQRGV